MAPVDDSTNPSAIFPTWGVPFEESSYDRIVMRTRVLLVYNADGGLMGELAYFAKKALGVGDCKLCALTHQGAFERSSWQACRRRIDADVVQVHRNELSAEERRFIAGRYPCVVSESAGTYTLILGPTDFAPLEGRPEKLYDAITNHLRGFEGEGEGGRFPPWTHQGTRTK